MTERRRILAAVYILTAVLLIVAIGFALR